jgi:hypothetical protein
MLALALRDLRRDPAFAELPAVGGVVVPPIGGEAFGPTARPAGAAAHRRHTVEQRDQLRDVVAVAAG